MGEEIKEMKILKLIYLTSVVLAARRSSYSRLQPCCNDLTIDGDIDESFKGSYKKGEGFINGRIYYTKETEGGQRGLAVWYNRYKQWVLGYESDARKGYSGSGMLYSTPANNMERKCPQNSQKWFKWHMRQWIPVDRTFFIRCNRDVVKAPPKIPECTLLYAKCSGPFFTVSFNEDCRKQLEPFRIFIDEKFGVGPRGNKDPFCRFRKNHADSGPTIEFNAGQCDTKITLNDNKGLRYSNELFCEDTSMRLKAKPIECQDSPSWWNTQYRSTTTQEYGYDPKTRTINFINSQGSY